MLFYFRIGTVFYLVLYLHEDCVHEKNAFGDKTIFTKNANNPLLS